MEMMMPTKAQPDLTNMSYPTLISPKFYGNRAIFTPEGFTLGEGTQVPQDRLKALQTALKEVGDFVLDGIITFDHSRFIVFDAMPVKDWNEKLCDLVYEERLQLVHTILNTRVARYHLILDCPADRVNYPHEIKTKYKNYLEAGYAGIILRNPEGLYIWENSGVESDEMMKLEPTHAP
jgi:ATP dependent DNA ligase domain